MEGVYPSDRTDSQWQELAPLIPAAKPGRRPRHVDMRGRSSTASFTSPRPVVRSLPIGPAVRYATNGIFYLLRVEACGFEVLLRRWIVERTFGWFHRYRRLSKDYEFLLETSESMLLIAMIHLMVKRLRPCPVT